MSHQGNNGKDQNVSLQFEFLPLLFLLTGIAHTSRILARKLTRGETTWWQNIYFVLNLSNKQTFQNGPRPVTVASVLKQLRHILATLVKEELAPSSSSC